MVQTVEYIYYDENVLTSMMAVWYTEYVRRTGSSPLFSMHRDTVFVKTLNKKLQK